MATPNLINVDTITPVVNVGAVTTSRADIVDVTAEYCAKINSLIIANIDGTNAADITVEVSTDNPLLRPFLACTGAAALKAKTRS